MVGEVTVEANGDVYQITGALEKTQIGSQPEAGTKWPGEATANNKKQALDKAYSLAKISSSLSNQWALVPTQK